MSTPLTPERIQRAQDLRDDGLPCSWIAEDINSTARMVMDVTTANEETGREWARVWSHIVRHKTLLDLHHEFAPPLGARGGRALR
jgi:hypothetical protein